MFKLSHSSSEQHFQTKLDHSRNVRLAAEDSEIRVAVEVFRLKRIVGAYECIGAVEENPVEDVIINASTRNWRPTLSVTRVFFRRPMFSFLNPKLRAPERSRAELP